MKRRTLLVSGAASALVAIGGGAWLSTKDIEQARKPWRVGGRVFSDPRMEALSYAILAPNPHNRQPWLIELIGDDQFVLLPDMERMLPETDPPNRQITIGYGAFLELFRQAASKLGFDTEMAPFPHGGDAERLDGRPIAIVTIKKGNARPDPLVSTILTRRTNREEFDPARSVETSAMRIISQAARDSDMLFNWTSEQAEVEGIRRIAKEGWIVETANDKTHHESTRLTRIGASEVIENPDGVSITGPLIESLAATGQLTREKMNQKGSFAYDQVVKFYDGLIDNTATFGWLISPDNERETQLRSGAAWVRINQTANSLGIAFHPLSQVLQEFPQMDQKYQEIHQLLGVTTPSRIQGLFRFGFAAKPDAAPRWPLESRIIA